MMILVMWYMMAKGDRMVVARSLVLVEEVEPEILEPRVKEQYKVNTRLMMVVENGDDGRDDSVKGDH